MRKPFALFPILFTTLSLFLLLLGCETAPVSSEEVRTEPTVLIPQEKLYKTRALLAKFSMTPDSLIHGDYEEFDPEGKLHRRIQYAFGSINGRYESFFPDGKTASRYRYENGHAHGPYTWYYEDGQVYQEGEKVWGKAEGEVVFYHPDGKVQSRQYYRDDRLYGPAHEYYPDGQLHLFLYFDDIGERRFYIDYDEAGNISSFVGKPFVNLEGQYNKLKGEFSLEFDLAVPPDTQPELRLLRRQEDKAWLCPLSSDSTSYHFKERLRDDFAGKYQLTVSYPQLLDTLRFREEVYLRNNEVYYGEPIGAAF